MTDKLAAIVDHVRRRLAENRDLERERTLRREAEAMEAPVRPLLPALMGETVAVIAEYKRRSPSRGPIREDLGPEAVAQAYVAAGATAISVLTEPTYFDGRLEYIQRIRRCVEVPLLRKDFIVSRTQIDEARVWGADAVLLIVRALDDEELRRFLEYARGLEMEALVEVHTEGELERALDAGASIVGVNNRDLRRFVTELSVTERLAGYVPQDRCLVSESGISRRADVERVAAAGADAVLVGEALMRAPDPGAKARELVDVPTSPGVRPTEAALRRDSP